MTHSKQIVELEFNPELPNCKSHFLYHGVELEVEKGGGRKKLFQVKGWRPSEVKVWRPTESNVKNDWSGRFLLGRGRLYVRHSQILAQYKGQPGA